MKKKHKKLISAIIAILIVLLYNYYTKDIEPSNANKENIPVIKEVTSDLQTK